MTWTSIERQQKILQLMEHEGRVTVAQVCAQFQVSEATARRDLAELAAQSSALRRTHGGLVKAQKLPGEQPLSQRSAEQAEAKQRIGAAAASLVEDGDTLFLGSGTTVLELAHQLANRPHGPRGLTVITNSLAVLNVLSGRSEITLVSLGGIFRPSELSFIGHITEHALTEVRADKVFMGVHALDVDIGLMNAFLPETMTDRAILRIARKVIVLADHSKCGRTSTALLAPVESIHCLVTDAETPAIFIKALEARGVQVIIS
jgi:DeoR family transcriptional regulator, aga operon transcriptional repressor